VVCMAAFESGGASIQTCHPATDVIQSHLNGIRYENPVIKSGLGHQPMT
jgi:hypothetical protein